MPTIFEVIFYNRLFILLQEGEKIYLLEQPTAEWFRGRTRSGCEGLFPVNYVEVKVPLGGCGEGATHALPTQPRQEQEHKLHTARCLYNFPGEVDGDLALRVRYIIYIYFMNTNNNL